MKCPYLNNSLSLNIYSTRDSNSLGEESMADKMHADIYNDTLRLFMHMTENSRL